MDWPYKFPHPADVIAEEAERFRRLSPDERLREIGEMSVVAEQFLAASPRREAVIAQIEADERMWREAHQRIFKRHGF